jgi:hypothetical protein
MSARLIHGTNEGVWDSSSQCPTNRYHGFRELNYHRYYVANNMWLVENGI